jgi:16S rRNA (guanine527-N7)-methyltransferase
MAPDSSPLEPAPLGALAAEMGLALDPAQCSTLIAYAALLRRWNRVHNLTAIETDADLLTHHLLDCLAIIGPLERAMRLAGTGEAGTRFLDAGSGAGLPGIPLAVARPRWHATLVDAVQKKCAFLEQARLELGLRNVTVHHARLESPALARLAGSQDLIVSRAFASLREFVTMTAHLLRPGGLWAAMKGRDPSAEIADLPRSVEWVDTITLRVPRLAEERHLVLLQAAPAPEAAPEPAADRSPRHP